MLSLTSAAVVAVVALLAPLVVRLAGLRMPEIVLQILLGIVVGPQVLGWAGQDAAVRVLSVVGLAFLLLLAGLEIDFDRLRGRVLRLTSAAFALSFALAVAIGFALGALGLVASPLLVGVILSATSLGIILPVLKDAGQLDTPFGQVVAAGLLQATSLSIPVVAGAIGVELGLIRPANYVALVAPGLLSVVLFPLLALPRLGRRAARPPEGAGPPRDPGHRPRPAADPET